MNKIIVNFVVIGLFCILIFNFFFYASIESTGANEASDILSKDIRLKTDQIDTYLLKINDEIKEIQDSEHVKELFEQDLFSTEEAIKMDVDERSRIISQEAENYLKAHPEMTLKDLQEDEIFNDIVVRPVSKSFKDIVVQPVGKEGYSFAFDTESLINYFHKEETRVGFDYNEINETFPELWNLFKENSEKGFSENFYHREEIDGSISYKYGKFVQIPVATADGISISLGTTSYVNDYKVIKEKSNYLDSIKESSNYSNIILISPEGYVIYMVQPEEDYGTNLMWEVNLEKGLSKHYGSADAFNISFYGPFLDIYGEIYPQFSVMAPVYKENNLLGYITILEEMDKVFEIATNNENLGETGEVYLINNEGFLITPLRKPLFDIMIQTISSKNAQDCIEHLNLSKDISKHKERTLIYENYDGEKVLGIHTYIPETKWCVIAEISKGESIKSKGEKLLWKGIYFSIILLGIFLITGIVYSIRNKEIKKFMKKTRFSKYLASIAFSLLFVAILVYILKIPKANLHIGLLPDLISLVLFSFLFFYAISKKPGTSKKLILIGSAICIISQIMQIILGGTFFEGSPSSILWSIILFVTISGISLILFGFRGVVK